MTEQADGSLEARLRWLRLVLGLVPPPAPRTERAEPPESVLPNAGGTGAGPQRSASLCRAAAAGLVVAVAITAPAAAQDERRLQQALEGQRVMVLIDMPATSQGIDVFPGTSRPIDFQRYAGRIKEFGVSLREGDRSLITRIRVKSDLIEVQLGGGGYGTFGDVVGSALTNQGADSGAAQQLQIGNERAQRLASGSRFNLRYPSGVTARELETEAIVAALRDYLSFPALAAAPAGPRRGGGQAERAAAAEPLAPKRGMSRDEVERLAGSEESPATGRLETRIYAAYEVDFYNDVAIDVRPRSDRAPATLVIRRGMSPDDLAAVAGRPLLTSASGLVTTSRYRLGDLTLEADFVNGVLVGYRVGGGR